MKAPASLFLALPCAALLASGCNPAAAPADYLQFTGCEEQTALILVPAALMPALPEGFAYTTPAGDVGVAAIHISGAECASVDGGEGDRNMLAFALVEPLPALKVPEIATYAVALGGYSSRPGTVEAFERWGLTGLIRLADVTVQLTETPLGRLGQVSAIGSDSQLTTRINVSGPLTEPGGGHTRAYFIRDGVLVASLDAVYTPQQAYFGAGSISQTGNGPLPLADSPAVGSHAFGYDLQVGFVQRY